WFISRDRSITHIKTSNQLLYDDGIVHAGNEFPVKFSEKVIKSLSFNLAKKLALEGFIGPFGIDFIETKFRKYYAVECNPRVTGANYPWELVHVLNQRHGSQDSVKSARAVNIHLNKKRLTFKDLMVRWKRVLYSGDCANGIIIPFNVGPVSSGKVTVLGTGTSNEEVNDLFKFLRWN
ncbi:MAG: ATP-grasp domain-containing protein, partial [Candidatus Heimdallarchaeota archaeon]